MVSGKRLIEASSRPTRTYVGFDRQVFNDLIETYAQRPDRAHIFLLDREYHLFGMAYLHSRFEYAWEAVITPDFGRIRKGGLHAVKQSSVRVPDDRMGPQLDEPQEDMAETLADA